MGFIRSVVAFFDKHRADLDEAAQNEANIHLMAFNLRFNRVRTQSEQVASLDEEYKRLLKALEKAEKSGIHLYYLMPQMAEISTVRVEDAEQTVKKFENIGGYGSTLNKIDFTALESLKLNEIPEDHPVFLLFKEQKKYLANLILFERINGYLNQLNSSQENDKLQIEDTEEIGKGKYALTVGQRVLLVTKLMRWAGIASKTGFGAKQQRFISAITGIPLFSVKDKFPTGSRVPSAVYLKDLQALIPLFDDLKEIALSDKIQAEIRLEEEERENLT